jgi:hypothetical protein
LAKASTGQSTNILELQNTAGVTVAGVDASGNGVGGLAHPPTFKNLIINGAMQVAQRSTSVTGVTASGYYTADRMGTSLTGLGTWTNSVENDAPTGSGFRKSWKWLCTTADASPASTDRLLIRHPIEGQNLQQIKKGTAAAEQLTLSFWVKANVTGTYIAELVDGDNTRQVSKSYSISASETWEKKTITFPADTTGALDNDNAESLTLIFWLGSGTDWTSGTLNTSWASTTNANRAVNQTNLAAATDNYWQITGVQLEVGSTATPFEFVPYETEFRTCERYFQKSGVGTFIGRSDGTTSECMAQFRTVMRGAPTVTLKVGTTLLIIPNVANLSPTSVSGISASVYGTEILFSGHASQTAGQIVLSRNQGGRVDFSAEL